jgi:hypothetical protein
VHRSGASRRGNAEARLVVIAREGGRSSIPEAPENKPKGRGILDRPVKPDDDNSLWKSDLSAVAQRAKAEATKQSIHVVPAKAGTHNHRR